MIKAVFYSNSDGHIFKFKITGHADSGPYGQDIVCSAVSVLAIGTINSLKRISDINPDIESNDLEGGYLECKVDYASIKDHDRLTSAITLMDSCYQTIESVAKNYNNFIKVELNDSIR